MVGDRNEIRVAVAMNGGVSLAVWIAGVAYELSRFSRSQGRWSELGPNKRRRVDVMAGTSAGGLNAAFLALAEIHGADLAPLRDLWRDLADLEVTGPARDGELLRQPTGQPKSLLDGDYFLRHLVAAFGDILTTADPNQDTASRAVDLRLTATSLKGRRDNVHDDMGGTFPNQDHRALFRFRHGVADRADLGDDGDGRLAVRLGVAARATAAFPFAFDAVSVGAGDFDDELAPPAPHHLVDGGVLNNLPIDEAIDAIFDMPAEEPVARYLVAVVPDPTTDDPTGHRPTSTAPPSVADIVFASAVGIPRNQSVARFLHDVRSQNAHTERRRAARQLLLEQPLEALAAAATTLFMSYSQQVDIDGLAPRAGVGFDDPSIVWSDATVRRAVAFTLDVLTAAGPAARQEQRLTVHRVRRRAEVVTLDGTTVEDRVTGLAGVLFRVVRRWKSKYADVATIPTALNDITSKHDARRLLLAVEIVQAGSLGADDRVEQGVTLGILTPLRMAPLDADLNRHSAKKKLAGDELGHFGAFLKQSWRANDWMWGRIDAATFFTQVLGTELGWDSAVTADNARAVQREIVEEEAPAICKAVVADLNRGAHCEFGSALVVAGPIPPGSGGWPYIKEQLALGDDDPHRSFLTMNRIGEETVKSETWTPLVARVATRAAAVAGRVLLGGRVPGGRFVAAVVRPVGGIAAITYRYVAGLRPATKSTALFRRTVLLLGATALAAFASLTAVDLGYLGGAAWLALGAALIALSLLAPLTTALAVVLLVPIGAYGALPSHALERWLPAGWPRWMVSLHRPIAIAAATAIVVAMSSRRVDRVDAWWRAVLRRTQENHDRLRDVVDE